MKNKFKINVHQGFVHINSVQVLQATKDVILVYADCREKYPDVASVFEDDIPRKFGCTISLCFANADEASVNEPYDNPTIFEIELLDVKSAWSIVTDSTRYGFKFALIRNEPEKFVDMEWLDDEEGKYK